MLFKLTVHFILSLLTNFRNQSDFKVLLERPLVTEMTYWLMMMIATHGYWYICDKPKSASSVACSQELLLCMLSPNTLTDIRCNSASPSRPYRCLTLCLSSPSFLCLPDKLGPSRWQVSSPTAACPKTTRPDSRERADCITRTYYDDEMSYKTPNTLLQKSLPPIRWVLPLSWREAGGGPNLIGSAARKGRV